ncbi:MAG: glucose-1-phosphate adenylyltransferase subunit GlgD [Oscillospiraceae bacterium]|jgi:glucose-1-phosphate adenylyltransferase|nr:glucose-1-phosphate adenylyltransferase subunit GlgD [Oscillospiraceae bacterium]
MTVGLYLSDPARDSVRTLSAGHYAGRYRIIDFTLSNLVNSGIYRIGIVLGSKYQTLVSHLGSGKDWDLARKSGGITFFPPYLEDLNEPYPDFERGSNALHRALLQLSGSKIENVLIVDGSIAYNMDYRPLIEQHETTQADVTAVYTCRTLIHSEAPLVFAPELDSRTGRVTHINYGISVSAMSGIASKAEHQVLLNTFVIRKSVLMRLLANSTRTDIRSFIRYTLAPAVRTIRVLPFEYKGYSAQLLNNDTFFERNMEMLSPGHRNALFKGAGNVYTAVRDSSPTNYGTAASAKNCIIADGCKIEGTAENCVIFRNVHIAPGARVRNCVLQTGTEIMPDAKLDWCITDKNVIITNGKTLVGAVNYPLYINDGTII